MRTPDESREDCPNKGISEWCIGWKAYGNPVCSKCYRHNSSPMYASKPLNVERMLDGLDIKRGLKKK